MRLIVDDRQFRKDMDNIINYSLGFVDGIKMGRTKMLQIIGLRISEIFEQYIDAAARSNPAMLHHVYEWYQAGNSSARLFKINSAVDSMGISFKTKFLKSQSIQDGSKEPFVNKAAIMEAGTPVLILPKSADSLKFEVNGETIYRPDSFVMSPGGTEVAGGFEETFNEFFNVYFRQSFLYLTGLADHFKKPVLYKQYLRAGKTFGRSAGITAGYRWVTELRINR